MSGLIGYSNNRQLRTLGLKANDDNISKVQVNMGHSDRRVSEIYAKAQAQADRSTTENTARLMGFK